MIEADSLIMAFTAVEDTSPMGIIAPAVETDVSLETVMGVANDSGLTYAFQEWWDDLTGSGHPKLVITIEPTHTICTTITVEYGGATVAQVETWHIGNVMALLLDQLEAQAFAEGERTFASDLLALLKSKQQHK